MSSRPAFGKRQYIFLSIVLLASLWLSLEFMLPGKSLRDLRQILNTVVGTSGLALVGVALYAMRHPAAIATYHLVRIPVIGFWVRIHLPAPHAEAKEPGETRGPTGPNLTQPSVGLRTASFSRRLAERAPAAQPAAVPRTASHRDPNFFAAAYLPPSTQLTRAARPAHRAAPLSARATFKPGVRLLFRQRSESPKRGVLGNVAHGCEWRAPVRSVILAASRCEIRSLAVAG